MKHITTETTPAKTAQVCRRVTIGSEIHWHGGRAYDVRETEVRWKSGWSCPDGGNGETVHVHICPACFEGRLLPWLKTQGADWTVEKWDF